MTYRRNKGRDFVYTDVSFSSTNNLQKMREQENWKWREGTARVRFLSIFVMTSRKYTDYNIEIGREIKKQKQKEKENRMN